MRVVDDGEHTEPEVARSPDAPDLDEGGVEADAPRFDDRPLRQVIDLAVVAGCALFVFWQVHPQLVLENNTPSGGDMGAHVWALGYLRDVLLPDLRVTGWSPDWYAGFPVFQFYMVVPFLGMILLNAGLAGAPSLLPAAGSALLSARAAGAARWRSSAAVTAGGSLVALLVGALFGFGISFRFLLMVLAGGAAITAIVVGTHRHRRWLGAAALVLALAGIAMPYGVAFKLVAVAGVVAMPVSSYLFGRLSGLAYPTPALLSVATLAFLFDTNFRIYGGNLASTMAGEFAFSISLALAIAYLGVLVHGLRTGTHRATAAVLLALVGLCHLIPAFFALAATAVLLAIHVVDEVPVGAGAPRQKARAAAVAAAGLVIGLGGVAAVLDVASAGPIIAVCGVGLTTVAILWWSRLGPDPTDTRPAGRVGLARSWWLLSAGAVGGLLAAWWVLPFYLQRTYLNDMGWAKLAVHSEGTALWDWFIDSVWTELGEADHMAIFSALAVVGAVLALVFRSRVGSALVILGLLLVTAFVYAPQGRLWNARLLPFWYLVIYFLAALAVGEIARAVSQVVADRPARPVRAVCWVVAPLALLAVGVGLGAQLRNLPFGETRSDGSYRALASVGIPGVFSVDVPEWMAIDVDGTNIVGGWSRWNFTGYEGKDAYPEYRDIVITMADLGERNGCGMSLWEYNQDLNDYGTPMALMLLPHWTDGCIGSMEGLYFEASSTTPFHFLMQSELSASPSRAQRDMPYRELDMEAGVEHMQLMGVRYYLAKTVEANTAAAAHADLSEVAASGPWVVYEVADAPMVEAVADEPAVTTAGEGQATWLGCYDGQPPCPGVALDWFQDRSAHDIPLAADGPEEWQRVDPGEQPEARPLSPAVVTDVEVGREGISFTVDRPGTPVLVKQSYFPNWRADGAEGPYRVAPNLMLVVPTDTEVALTYGRSGVDYAAMVLTLVGLALAVALARAGPIVVRRVRDEAEL